MVDAQLFPCTVVRPLAVDFFPRSYEIVKSQGMNYKRDFKRITFEWEDGDALKIDMEQYHRGKTMEEYLVRRPLKRPQVHPGEIFREDVLKSLDLSVSEAARRLGVSRQQRHRILACTHPITIEMALRIGKFAGNGPGL